MSLLQDIGVPPCHPSVKCCGSRCEDAHLEKFRCLRAFLRPIIYCKDPLRAKILYKHGRTVLRIALQPQGSHTHAHTYLSTQRYTVVLKKHFLYKMAIASSKSGRNAHSQADKNQVSKQYTDATTKTVPYALYIRNLQHLFSPRAFPHHQP